MKKVTFPDNLFPMGRPKTMATRKPVSLPPELAKAVEDYRFANRFKTESDAIRELIELGLKAAKAKAGRGR
jgi:Arc/MetJ-type ribon-helix-helix transcriptional regulator